MIQASPTAVQATTPVVHQERFRERESSQAELTLPEAIKQMGPADARMAHETKPDPTAERGQIVDTYA